MKYSAVIAAAGMSSRMGEFKPLMPLGNSTIIGNVINTLQTAGINDIAVVTGRCAHQMEEYLADFGVISCFNPDFETSDMLASVKIGIRALEKDYDRLFVTPGDVPAVNAGTVKKMMQCRGQIVKPFFNGRSGHPVMLEKNTAEGLLFYTGERGMAGYLEATGIEPELMVIDDEGTIMDADTPDEYFRLKEYFKSLKNKNGS